MTDPAALPLAALSTAAIALVSAAGLKAWRQWLELKRTELARVRAGGGTEIGELRRRVRRLEALASGIEL